MDAYELLRKEAATKMDKAIKAARDEYRAEVAKINELRAALGHSKPLGLRSRKTITEILREQIPQSRPFLVTELITNCKALYPAYRFKRSTVRTSMHKMSEDGLIRRIGKDRWGYIIWAVADLEVAEKPYGAMPMSDVIADLLHGSEGMRPAELVVAMQQIGYRANDDPHLLVRNVTKSLYGNPRRFVRDAEGRWGMLATL